MAAEEKREERPLRTAEPLVMEISFSTVIGELTLTGEEDETAVRLRALNFIASWGKDGVYRFGGTTLTVEGMES